MHTRKTTHRSLIGGSSHFNVKNHLIELIFQTVHSRFPEIVVDTLDVELIPHRNGDQALAFISFTYQNKR